MAATRLIPLHVNKGKTVAQCLADRTDYSENAAKTNDGEFISSYMQGGVLRIDVNIKYDDGRIDRKTLEHITPLCHIF